jgi:hypothetical protein
MAKKLGYTAAIPDSMRDEFFEIVEASNDLCGLRFVTADEDKRGDIELYGVKELPAKLGKAGYADYEDGRELIVIEFGVAERERDYRLALYTHEWLHGLKLKHGQSGDKSIMVPGLKREGEGFYRTEPGEDDVETLIALYGPA